jgi:KaiC/GvpD/RAD55 family RecA-like ATPase
MMKNDRKKNLGNDRAAAKEQQMKPTIEQVDNNEALQMMANAGYIPSNAYLLFHALKKSGLRIVSDQTSAETAEEVSPHMTNDIVKLLKEVLYDLEVLTSHTLALNNCDTDFRRHQDVLIPKIKKAINDTKTAAGE